MISENAREKLSIAAKKNNLGGVVIVKKLCKYCGLEFDGKSNSKYCNNCMMGGFPTDCEYCGNHFKGKSRYVKYCPSCVDNRVWHKKLNYTEISKKAQKTKKV